MDNIQEMEKIIEELRAQLHKIADGRCFTDPEVIKASQELDQKLNEYERLINSKNSSARRTRI